MNDTAHHVQRDIRKVLRIEREEATFYGLHNKESFEKIKKLFKYIVIEPINAMTVRVVKYTDDEKLALSFARENPKYAIVIDGEFII